MLSYGYLFNKLLVSLIRGPQLEPSSTASMSSISSMPSEASSFKALYFGYLVVTLLGDGLGLFTIPSVRTLS